MPTQSVSRRMARPSYWFQIHLFNSEASYLQNSTCSKFEQMGFAPTFNFQEVKVGFESSLQIDRLCFKKNGRAFLLIPNPPLELKMINIMLRLLIIIIMHPLALNHLHMFHNFIQEVMPKSHRLQTTGVKGDKLISRWIISPSKSCYVDCYYSSHKALLQGLQLQKHKGLRNHIIINEPEESSLS